MKTEVVAIVFTDLVGFTELTSHQSHEQNARTLKRLSEVVQPLIRSFGGRVVKEIGDGVLSVFEAPTDAVRAAMAIQDRLAETNAGVAADQRLRLRVAINVGEVRIERGDVFGEAVNVAARIESKTPADAIYVSESTMLTMNRVGIPLERVGELDLKGIAEPVVVWKVPAQDERAEAGDRADTLPYLGRQLAELRRHLRRRRIRLGLAAVAATLLMVTSGIVAQRWGAQASRRAALRAAIEQGQLDVAAAAVSELRAAGMDVDAELQRLFESMEVLEDAVAGCQTVDRLEFLREGPMAHALTRLRLTYGFSLIVRGELAQARACLARVQSREGSVAARVATLNEIHLEAMEALAHHRGPDLRRAFQRYEEFLRAGTAPPEHQRFIAELAAKGYLHRDTRPVADSLVLELKAAAIPSLVERALDPGLGPTPRAWILARLEGLAADPAYADAAIDWRALYGAVLQDDASSCGMRRSALEGFARLQSLRDVGLVAREASRNDPCTRGVARTIAAELVAHGRPDAEPSPAGPVVVAAR